ncbi:hypothetical protein NHF46_23620 [Arthrobacter alpinus]|nr:hypothetical protein [Arthrobacter alpinus]
MHEASARLAGGSLVAASALISGAVPRAVNFGGGMHHAFAGKASGFCIYNDTALSIQKLLDSGVSRWLTLTLTRTTATAPNASLGRPRVLTISLHETGLTLFPGTGFANDIGGPNATGSAVNVSLPAGTSDAGWLRAFHAVVPQLVEAFAPEVIVSQHGCDSHRDDELTHLNTSVDGQREAALSIAALADKVCGGAGSRQAAAATTLSPWCRECGVTSWQSWPGGRCRCAHLCRRRGGRMWRKNTAWWHRC